MSSRPRLSARRGSTTAPDPFGIHADVNLNPNRSSSSVLTIVRVSSTPATTPPVNLHEPPSSPVLSQRRLHRPGRPAAPDSGTGRVSFAFSSFGGQSARPSSPGGASRDHPPSPSSSPRLRPSSPHLSASSSFTGKPRLTPDQLVDLARQATANPRAQTPVSSHSPVLRTHALPAIQPATFTPLPIDIYLPFIDRTSEVAALISTPPDAKLFALLAQTFRNKSSAEESSALLDSDKPIELPRDPTLWTYNQLIYHLTHIDRDIAPDFIWAIAARKCILSHSELIWERIKGALGVPPELDIEYDFLDDDESSPDTSDISDDEGKGARGHWSDWDDVMDSPIYSRNKRLSMDSPVASLYTGKHTDAEANFRSQVDDKLHGLREGFVHSSSTEPTTDGGGESTIAPTPHGKGARSPPEHHEPGNFNPYDGTLLDSSSSDYLSIEPLIAPSSANSNTFSLSPSGNPPPMSLPASLAGGDGLGDIAEGAEEEDENENDAVEAPAPASEDPDMIVPSQIQGLRISTTPLPPSASFGTPPILSPISPLPPYPHVPVGDISASISQQIAAAGGNTQPQPIPNSTSYSSSRPHSRASSFSSIGPFQKSESTGNLSASWSAAAMAALSGSAVATGGSQYAASVIGSDAGDSSGYISDGDRLPGHPLFPSNFARLNVGPSMRANNPATRSTQQVPTARYISNATFGGPSLVNRPGKVRAYSHGASTRGLRPGAVKRQSWGSVVQGDTDVAVAATAE